MFKLDPLWSMPSDEQRMVDFPAQRRPNAAASPCLELQKGHDDDRRHFARNLHDEAQQTLAAASMRLSLLERQAPDLPVAARASLTEAQKLIARCNLELRSLAERLHPPLLDEMGLVTALRGLFLRVGKARLDLDVDAALPRFEDVIETAAFKLADETIATAFSAATPVKVVASHADGALHLQLTGTSRDDGVDDQAGALDRYLDRLAFRIRAIGGQLHVNRVADRLALEAIFSAGGEGG